MLKKYTITIFLSLLSLFNLSAQHMSFLGIPMGINVDTFKQRLLQKEGFKDNPLLDKGYTYVDGSFAGKDALIAINYSNKSRIVVIVSVGFKNFSYDTNSFDADKREALQLEYYDDCKKSLINMAPIMLRNIQKII